MLNTYLLNEGSTNLIAVSTVPSLQLKYAVLSDLISSQQIGEEKMKIVTGFIFLGSQITLDSDCSLEIKICLLLRRKPITNLDRILKSRHITLPTKLCIVKAMVFPVVTYRC